MALKDKVSNRSQDDTDEEQTEKATEAAEDRLEQAGDDATDAKGTAENAVGAAVDAVKDTAKQSSKGLFMVVATAARDAAAEVLEREARAGAKQAAEYLSQKGPELARKKIEESGGTGPATKAAMAFGKAKLDGAGGPKAVLAGAGGAVKGVAGNVKGVAGNVKGVAEKVKPGGGEEDGGGDKGLGQTRRLPIECTIDIGAPCETVYNQWTQFEDAPKYMQRITSVDQVEDDKLKVKGKIWGFNREWTVEIEEQIPNERIQWRVVGGTQHSGVVTFHEIEEDLTRVILILDFPPQGLTEKMASGLRLVKRATTADLKRFRAFVMLRGDETGAWRGKIEDGEVTSPEDLEQEESEAEGEEEPQAEGEEEPQAEGEEPEEEEYEEEPQAEGEEPEEEEYEEEPQAEGEEPEEEEYEEEPQGEADEEPEAAEEEEPAEAESEPAPRRPQPRRQRTRGATSEPAPGTTRRKTRTTS